MSSRFYRTSSLLVLLLACTAPAMAEESVDTLVRKGAFYGDIRYRFENVDQDGPSPIRNDATASTVRTRAGFKTGVYQNFQGLFETELVGRLNAEDYNDGKNGHTTYPVIADPQTVELNQLWLSWAGIPDTTVKVGRQVINLDNQRFVGSVGWRQNDQTFDAATIENKSIENLSASYSYLRSVNRVFGHDHPQGDWGGNSHLAHLSYAAAPWLTATGYGYWLDFDLAPSSSNETFGLRLTGDVPVDSNWTFFYEAEAAHQSDHARNTANYDEGYYHVAPGFKGHGFSFQAGFESLGGDGTNAFQTPLATLHAFNGWADKFLTTPGNGLEDAYAKASYKVSGMGAWADDTVFDAVYHDFGAQKTGADYGTEWNLQVGRTFKTEKVTAPFKEWSVSLKYADYNADELYTDTEKVWFTVGTKF